MTLLTLIDAELAYGLTPLLDRAQLSLAEGERVGLIGRNGTGKSSLLAAIAGRIALDGGEIRRRDGLHVVSIEQEPELPPAATLRASLTLRGGLDEGHDERERWRLYARLVEYLHRFGLEEDADPSRVSGGERKRATLALAFALHPDLLLLDEPTNHLDFEGIERLEALLVDEQRGGRAAVVVTHDRRFLDRVATRIVELDRGWLRSYPGNFAAYLARRTDELEAETSGRRKFDRFWAQEEGWIRKGVEARRTRNAGRVRRLDQLRRERGERLERLGNIKLRVDAGARSGRLVAELTDVGKRFGSLPIAQGLTLRLMRGDRLALIGRNGAGKSTLIRLILGELAPDAGTVKLGTQLQIAYFDQLRAQLDPDRTVSETIAPGSDWIEIGATRKHVMSYLADFLFPPRRAESPVRMLSGGERNRLLLARLFARPANLLVLDEPTNDLDIESLELLEATVADYDGTVLLVSHDREFVDAVATQSLVAEGAGVWKEYAGGYSDWLAQRSGAAAAPAAASPAPAAPAARGATAPRPLARPQSKPSFNEQRELQRLPAEIEALELEQSALHAKMAAADYHRQGAERIRQDRARAEQLEHLLAQKFERWAELEQRAGPARDDPPAAR
ncbi:MAG TPA: ATP-binding cassette domain-containing protein [Burkholderiaceae bacterium]